MGFSGIASSLLIFIAVMTVSASVIIALKGQVDDAQSAISSQKDRIDNELKSDYMIDFANYNSGVIYLYVRNSGSTIIDNKTLDVYVDNVRIPRNVSNRTLQIAFDSEITDVGIWNPKEVMEIQINYVLQGSTTYTISITSDFGARESVKISS